MFASFHGLTSSIFPILNREEFILDHIDDYAKLETTDLTNTILLNIDTYQLSGAILWTKSKR